MICKELTECYGQILTKNKISTCKNNMDQCIMYSDCRTYAKSEENKKKYTIYNINKNLITLYKMDEGIIVVDKTVPTGQGKCDYLYCVNSYDTAVLVELKGTDVLKALEQVYKTYILFNEFISKFKKVNCRIIVTNSMPRLLANPLYVKLQKIIKKKNGDILIKEKEYMEQM